MSATATMPDVCPRVTKLFVISPNADRERFKRMRDELTRLHFRPNV